MVSASPYQHATHARSYPPSGSISNRGFALRLPFFDSYLQAGTGDVAGGTKDLVKGVVGGTASSASKIVGSLDHAVRSAGSLDSKPSADTGPPEMAKVSRMGSA